MELYIQLAHGDPLITDISPSDFSEKIVGNVRIKLGAILPNQGRGSSRITEGSTNRVALMLSSPPEQSRSAVVLFIWPEADRAPIDVEVLDHDGRRIEAAPRVKTSFDLLHVINLSVPAESIKSIRVRHYPEMTRLKFTIPFLPGLPVENQSVTNLFDVRVPYMRVNSAENFRANLSSLLQMEVPWLSVKFRANIFPLVYTNNTASELLEEYLKYAPVKKQIYVNDATWALELRDSPLVEIWKRMKAVVGK